MKGSVIVLFVLLIGIYIGVVGLAWWMIRVYLKG